MCGGFIECCNCKYLYNEEYCLIWQEYIEDLKDKEKTDE